MKRLTRFRYEVSNGETISIKVTPVGVAPRVIASDNGQTLPNDGPADRPAYTVTIDQVPGNSHFVMIECDFLDSDPVRRTSISNSEGPGAA